MSPAGPTSHTSLSSCERTVGLKSGGSVVVVSLEVEIAKLNMGVVQYDLTISSIAGGSVTTFGERPHIYAPGTVINLVAEPEEGYQFVSWTGDVSTVGNVTAAPTTITMQDDYLTAANFEARANWTLIGGIIAVVVLRLVIFFVRRKRAA